MLLAGHSLFLREVARHLPMAPAFEAAHPETCKGTAAELRRDKLGNAACLCLDVEWALPTAPAEPTAPANPTAEGRGESGRAHGARRRRRLVRLLCSRDAWVARAAAALVFSYGLFLRLCRRLRRLRLLLLLLTPRYRRRRRRHAALLLLAGRIAPPAPPESKGDLPCNYDPMALPTITNAEVVFGAAAP